MTETANRKLERFNVWGGRRGTEVLETLGKHDNKSRQPPGTKDGLPADDLHRHGPQCQGLNASTARGVLEAHSFLSLVKGTQLWATPGLAL